MEKKKTFINIREILIAIGIALVAIIVGSINRNDLAITQSLYNHENTSLFGIFFSVIAEWPAYLGMVYFGTVAVVASKQLKKLLFKIVFIVGGIGVGAFGSYLSLHYAFKLKDFKNMAALSNLNVVVILFVVVCLLACAATVLGTLRLTKNKSLRELMTIIMFVGFVIACELVVVTGLKYLISRPRPYYLYDNNIIETGFKNWWEFNPLAALKEGSVFKSCPSGHSASSATAVAVLPSITLLTEHRKEDKKLQLVLFYVGLVWTLIMGVSRIYAGAHFLSDVGMGWLMTFVVVWIANIFLSRRMTQLENA